jgi:hypothetical protein
VSETSPLLGVGELGIDLTAADKGRVWVGDGSKNIALATNNDISSAVDAVKTKTDKMNVSAITSMVVNADGTITITV